MLRRLKQKALKSLRRRGIQIARIPKWRVPIELIDEAEHQSVMEIIQRVSSQGSGPKSNWTGESYTQRGRVAFYYELLDHWCAVAGDFPDDGKMLDVGAFHGYLLRLIHRRFPGVQLFGTEIHEPCLPIAAQVCPSATIHAGNVSAGADDGPYQRICLSEVMEHLEDPAAMARTLIDLLTPGGSAVFTVPNGRYDTMLAGQHYAEHGSYSGHINFWSLESWTLFWAQRFPDVLSDCRELSSGHLIAVIQKTSPDNR